jgi:hypothetical protein
MDEGALYAVYFNHQIDALFAWRECEQRHRFITIELSKGFLDRVF